MKDKILKGELVLLEIKENDDITRITMNKEEFREFMGCQENIGIMSDCITLLSGNQINIGNILYRLINGRKLVIDIFEEYSQHFIDAVNDDIEDSELWEN